MQDGSDMIDGSTDRSYERLDGVLVRNEEHVKSRFYEQSLHRENGHIKFQGEERLVSQEGVFVDTETLGPSESTAKFLGANVKVTSARQLRKEGTFKGANKEDRRVLDARVHKANLYKRTDGRALLSVPQVSSDGSSLTVEIQAVATATEHRVDASQELAGSTENSELVAARLEARGVFKAYSGLKRNGNTRSETYSNGDVLVKGQGDLQHLESASFKATVLDAPRTDRLRIDRTTKEGLIIDKTTTIQTTIGLDGTQEQNATEVYTLGTGGAAAVSGAAGAAAAEVIQFAMGTNKATAANVVRAAAKVTVAAVEGAALGQIGGGSSTALAAAQVGVAVGGLVVRAALDGGGVSAADLQKAAVAAAPAAGAVSGRAMLRGAAAAAAQHGSPGVRALGAAGLRAAGPAVAVVATALQRRGELTNVTAVADVLGETAVGAVAGELAFAGASAAAAASMAGTGVGGAAVVAGGVASTLTVAGLATIALPVMAGVGAAMLTQVAVASVWGAFRQAAASRALVARQAADREDLALELASVARQLGVRPNVPFDELAKIMRRQWLRAHPDKRGGDGDEFVRLMELHKRFLLLRHKLASDVAAEKGDAQRLTNDTSVVPHLLWKTVTMVRWIQAAMVAKRGCHSGGVRGSSSPVHYVWNALLDALQELDGAQTTNDRDHVHRKIYWIENIEFGTHAT
ncbi:hypothetical protein HK405_011687 [Cladochytrium tenue]|nr:hypothetical protein HK405_011687 [Cladochytrium tenue]